MGSERQRTDRTCSLIVGKHESMLHSASLGHFDRLVTSGDIIGDSDFVVLEPETWVGKVFPLIPYIDIGSIRPKTS